MTESPCAHRALLFSGAVALLPLLGAFGCGSSSSSATSPTSSTGFSQFGQVLLVVEENSSYSEVIGNSSMPYLNSLAAKYGLATQYFANTHPSLPNYLILTTGVPESFDDNFSGTISDNNVVRVLVNAGKTWKAYAESLPSPGYVGADAGVYVR